MATFNETLEDLSTSLGLISFVDEETGEEWFQNPQNADQPSSCAGGTPRLSSCKPSANGPSLTNWRIPKEYSKLGDPLARELEYKNGKMQAIWGTPAGEPRRARESRSCEDPDSKVVVTSVPLLGKLPSFCRKRQASGTVKIPDKKQGSCDRPIRKLRRFLNEREELLLVGRLLFVVLALLIPGFILPITFTLKMVCHFQAHYHNEECATDVFPFFQKGEFKLRGFPCSLCRERRKSDKLIHFHLYLKEEHKNRRASSDW